MIRQDYIAPTADIVDLKYEDAITTSILLPPHEFGRSKNNKNDEYDVF